MNNTRVRGALTTLKRNHCIKDITANACTLELKGIRYDASVVEVLVPSELLSPKKRIKIKKPKKLKK